MTQVNLPNAGIPAPIPDSFDFDGWMKTPKPLSPLGRNLRVRNAHNCVSERHNEASIDETLKCKDDRAGHPDVGKPLLAYYGYTEEDIKQMAGSEAICTSVGPLPLFVLIEVEDRRGKKNISSDVDKNKGKPLLGALVLDKPIARVAGEHPPVSISQIVLTSILHKLYPPLNWFTNSKLEIIQHRLHELDTKLFKPEPTAEIPNPDKVLTFDMAKMTKAELWGSDDKASCLTPLKWQEASQNMLDALVLLSEHPDISLREGRSNFAVEFNHHRQFFIKYGHFEESYSDWYPFEREARHDILRGILFDREHYAAQVDSILRAKAAAAIRPLLAALPITPSKRSSDSDLRGSNVKAPRTPNNDSPSSFRAESSSSFRSSPSSGSYTTCVACAGPHRLRDHPAGATIFTDGKPCIAILRDGYLWLARTLNSPEPQKICVSFNLPNGCQNHHDSGLAHVCSFCGKAHGALNRSSPCSRLTAKSV